MSSQVDLCGFVTTTTGTGSTITVDGSVTESGLRTLAQAITHGDIAVGAVVSYCIVTGTGSGTQRETGTATVGTGGLTLEGRTLVSSTTDALLSLTGTSTVLLGPNRADLAPATPAGTGTELQYRDAGAFGALGGAGGSSWTAGTKTLRLPTESKLYLHGTHNAGIGSSGDGYVVDVTNRYGATYKFKSELTLAGYSSGVRFDETTGPLITTHDKSNASSPPSLNVFSNGLKNLWLWGQYGGPYASSSNFHHGTGVSFWAGQGATPTTTNAAGGDAGNIDVWLNAGGAGNGAGAAGARGKMRVINDATDTEVWSVDQLGNMVQSGGTFKPAQYTTATRPAWSNGAVIFDTDLDKLVIGGVSAWEAVTSA